MNEEKEKLYIITIKWKNTFKKLYLGGEKGPSGEERLGKALMDIERVGDAAKTWEDFFNKSIDTFQRYGFTRIDL